MRKTLQAYSFAAVFFCTASSLAAVDRAEIITVVKNLKAACGQPDFTKSPAVYAKAAALIAYMGPDKTRKYMEPVNYTTAEDQKGVESVCNRINSLIGDIHTWGAVQTRTKRRITWHAITFRHTIKNKEKENLFAFVEIGGKLYLGDID